MSVTLGLFSVFFSIAVSVIKSVDLYTVPAIREVNSINDPFEVDIFLRLLGKK